MGNLPFLIIILFLINQPEIEGRRYALNAMIAFIRIWIPKVFQYANISNFLIHTCSYLSPFLNLKISFLWRPLICNLPKIFIVQTLMSFLNFFLSNVLCGQLQCEDSRDRPVVDYGWTYTKISLDNGKQCRY